MRSNLIRFCLVGIFCLTGCATVQDKIALSQRIARLERSQAKVQQNYQHLNRTMQETGKNWDTKGQDFTGQYASIRAEIRQLREEIQAYNGRVDELAYAVGQQNTHKEELEKALEALTSLNRKAEKRITSLEQYLGMGVPSPVAVAGPLPSKQPNPVEPAGVLPKPENSLYMQAKQAFDRGDYATARKAFQKFIELYPTSENADNAQFWIGETYYREAWYEKAILEYEEVKKKFPNGNKIPSTLLKQGMAFEQLKEKENARLILEELINRFTKSNEAEIARKVLKNMK